MTARICELAECVKPVLARNMCTLHYQRWRKHGDPSWVWANKGNRAPRTIPEVRTCTACGFAGPRDEFVTKRNLCKPCKTRYGAEWKLANPELVAASRLRNAAVTAEREKHRRASRKGIDPQIVAAYRADHHGGCDICGKMPSPNKDLAIDHDHQTGAFRGMLCDGCNQGLGMFGDDPHRLAAAIRYLGVAPGDLYDLITA